MDEITPGSSNNGPAPEGARGALDQTLALLKAKDDTSRFVGLTLVRSVLDNNEGLRNDPVVISNCWHAISAKFLDRMLKADKTESRKREEAQNMVDLAVAVVHTFAILLPPQLVQEEKMLGRTDSLVAALTRSSPDTVIQIVQTLLSFAIGPLGANAILSVEDLSPLLELGPAQPLSLDVAKFAIINADASSKSIEVLKPQIHRIISSVVTTWKSSGDFSTKQTNAVILLRWLVDLLQAIPPESAMSDLDPPPWLPLIVETMQTILAVNFTGDVQNACAILSSTLFQIYPDKLPVLLFTPSKKSLTSSRTTKPFMYLFVTRLLVDIRSTIPSLLEQIASRTYPAISTRLAVAYDVITALISYLVRWLDDEDDDAANSSSELTPDLLLQLRKNIAETLSLTLELLRDRWDAAVSGAAGLHPDARAGDASQQPLPLAWGTAQDVTADQLTAAAVQTLAMWLANDDNEALRGEAVGIMDVLLGLYVSQSSSPSTSTIPDHRIPVLTLLGSLLDHSHGVDAFIASGGWDTLFADLAEILAQSTPIPSEAHRGLEVERVLLAAAESSSSAPREDWLVSVLRIATTLSTEGGDDDEQMELRVGLWQIALELLTRVPCGAVRRTHWDQGRTLLRTAEDTVKEYNGGSESVMAGLAEVVAGLKEIGLEEFVTK